MTKRRLVTWLAGLSGLCVVLLLAVVILLPRILDSQAAKERIGAFLSSRTGGTVAVEGLDLAWFPRPAVVARGASLSLGDTVSGKIRSIEVYPSLRGLLTGHLDISRVELASPVLSVHLPEPAEEPSNIDEIEGQVRSLLASLAAQLPGMMLRVRGGSGEIRVGDRPPVVITDLGGRLVAPPGEMDLRFSVRTNIFDSLRVEARIDGETLAMQARISVENLRLRESMRSLLPGPHAYIESGTVSVNLSLTSVGLKNVKAEIEGALPSLALARGDRKTVIEGSAFKGVIIRNAGILNAVIERFDIVSPRVTVTGEFTIDPASSTVRLVVAGRELDVSRIRESALQIAGDVGFVETVFRSLGGGTIPEITLQTSGSSFAEMWKPSHIVVTATKRDGNVFVPGLDIDLEDVSGVIVVSGGLLEVKGFSARLGTIRGSEGALRLGLEGNDAPFHLDMMVQTDAAELQSLLLRVVKDDGFHRELSRIRHVTGDLSGRLILGERIDAIFPRVSIFKTALRCSHDLSPYPLSISEGRFVYGDGKIEVENVSGAVGLSSFSGLTGSLRNDESRQIEILAGRFSLDVAQTKSLLDRFHVWQDELADVDFARGGLELASVSLTGRWDDPSRWEFTTAGTLGEIAVQHAALPGVMTVSGGTFRATPAKVAVSDTTVNVLDASLRVDGSVASPGNARLSLEGAAVGSIGAEMTGWLSGRIGVPDLSPYPLSISEGRFVYGDGKIEVENVSGAVGLSSFSGLTGSLRNDESRQIEIVAGRFSLDVAQTKSLLDRFHVWQDELADVDFARGSLELASVSLTGRWDDPSRWEFTTAGTLGEIAVQHATLPGVMTVSGGTFRATPAKVAVSDTTVNVLDASLRVDGSVASPGNAPLSLEGAAVGSIGAEMTGWLSGRIGLPTQFLLRSPLQLTTGRVSWKKDGEVGFQGELTVAGGPRLSVDMVRAPHVVEVKEALIVDGEQRARMTLDLKEGQLAFSFAGALEQRTLDRIFQVPPPAGSLIQGDIEISAFLEKPLRFTARGRLTGRELRVPLTDDPAIIESFSLEAESGGVRVRSADVLWRNSRLSLVGNLLPEANALRLDMDIVADRVVWEEISEIVESGGNRHSDGGGFGIALPPLEGTLRFKTDTFAFSGFNWSPLHATAALSPRGIEGRIERGDVCGIGTVGRVDYTDGEIGLALSLSVTDGQLESTSLCLTGNRQAVAGRYALQAQIAGQGTPENVARTLRGGFEFSAQDGHFVRLANAESHSPLEATFDYLNDTDDFTVAFPDLHRESFPFRSIRNRGTVEGMTLVNDELTIQSSRFIVAGNGTVDLEHNQVDAKGLVYVRTPGDSILKRIPILGSIFGGSIVGIPVRVIGPLDRPRVTYLSPADVGAELLRVPMRILGLPLEAVRLFTPSARALERN